MISGGATPHYITALQQKFPSDPPGDLVYAFHADENGVTNGVTPTILLGASGTVLAKLDTGDPLVLATSYGAGRAVNFGSYDYMKADRFGFLMGVDDIFWRSLVWAARKPFVVRGYPHLFAVQMDDADANWIDRIADTYNTALTGNVLPDGTGGPWKPTGYFAVDDFSADAADRPKLISDIQAGLVEIGPHAIDLITAGGDLFWNGTTANTDSQWSTKVNTVMNWKNGAGGSDTIPSFSRSVVPHFTDLSNNAGYEMWNTFGERYITTSLSPGTYYYACKTDSQRMQLRPFRIYEVPPIPDCTSTELWPMYFADDLTVGSQAGFPAQTFFAFATWGPAQSHYIDAPQEMLWPQPSNWTVAQSVEEFERTTWRFWSGLAPFEHFSHDFRQL